MLSSREIKKIENLLKTGKSVSEIADNVGKSLPTVYKIRSKFNFSDLSKKPDSLSGNLLQFESYLKKRIKKGVINIKKLHSEIKIQEYKESYTTFYRKIKPLINSKTISKYKPSRRFETEPGEQAQVDWGTFGKIKINGKTERLCGFFYILSYSRSIYIEFTIKQNLQTLENCHIHAFERLGIPKEIVYDNMKTVVLRREKLPNGIKRLYFHPAFLDFSNHYGFKIKPCAPYWPRAKGKVESCIKYTRNNFMQGRKFNKDFFSINELNEQVKQWLSNVANVREHATTKEKPNDRWIIERKYLYFPQSFPRYETASFIERNSTKDGFIQYKSNLYSIPIKYARRKLPAKITSQNGVAIIKIYFKNKLIANHVLSHERGKWVVKEEHFSQTSTKTFKIKKNLNIKKKWLSIAIKDRPDDYYDQLI